MTPAATDGPDDRLTRVTPVWMAIAAAIVVLSALIRLYALRLLPPFIDESGHIYGATHYDFYPLWERLRAGKIFGYIVFYPAARFGSDPLHATRCTVALLGALTTSGVLLLTRRLWTMTASVVAGAIWAFMPYIVFHDRMALHDPLVSAFMIWSLVALHGALARRAPIHGVLAGVLLGLAILTKISALIGGVWLVVFAIAVAGPGNWRRYLPVLVGAGAGLAVSISGMVVGLARAEGLSTGEQFLRTGSDLWEGLRLNASTGIEWFVAYNGRPFGLLAAVTMVAAILRSSPITRALAACFLAALLWHAVLLKVWFPRYLLFCFLPLAMLMGIVIGDWLLMLTDAARRRFRRVTDWKVLGVAVPFCILLILSGRDWLRSDVAFAQRPETARLPPIDRYQYLDGWPAGRGVQELASFLNLEVQRHGRLLVIVGGFGRHGWWSLPTATRLDSRITMRSEHVASRTDLVRVASEAGPQPTFILYEPPMYVPPADVLALLWPPPKLAFDYNYPRSDAGFRLYALAPSTRVLSSLEEVQLAASGRPVIAQITNPNGLETWEGLPFLWMGGGDTVVQIVSPRKGTVDLQATYIPGPSVVGTPVRQVLVRGATGLVTRTSIEAGRQHLIVPVSAGLNDIVLTCTNAISIAKQPNGDTRPLLLGVQDLRIAAFDPDR